MNVKILLEIAVYCLLLWTIIFGFATSCEIPLLLIIVAIAIACALWAQ